MNHLIGTGLAISAIALFVPKAADAASLSINDATTDPNIIFSVGQFDTGVGFVLDGTTLLSPSSGNASRTVSEGTTVPIVHNFTGQFFTAGALSQPTSGVIAFTEAGGGISDILTFNYTGGGGSPGNFGTATLTGTFVSDLEPGGSLVAPAGATLVSEGTPFNFNNIDITASAVSDVDVVTTSEPGSLPLLAAGVLGLGFIRYGRKTRGRAV